MNKHWDHISSRPFACDRCFADRRLVEWIREKAQIGKCSWCKARKAYIVPIVDLGPHFREIAEIYHQDDSGRGEHMSFILQEGWEIFSERIVGQDHVVIGNELLQNMVVSILEAGMHPKELMERGIDYNGLFVEQEPYHSTLEENWEEEVAKLFSGLADGHRTIEGKLPGSRDDLTTGEDETHVIKEAVSETKEGILDYSIVPLIDTHERLTFAISDVGVSYPSETVLYRARIHKDRARETKFSLDELAAPPPEKARAQRANRAGDPVLYMASDLHTALAEVRAWKGAAVAVAKMKTLRQVSILDLSEPYNIDSPFFVEYLNWRIEANALLDRFGLELSRPLIPHEKETLYFPSQNLCDLVQNAGYDGIAYPSAMGPGHNVVLFDPKAAGPVEVIYKRVEEISFESRDMRAYEDLFDDSPW